MFDVVNGMWGGMGGNDEISGSGNSEISGSSNDEISGSCIRHMHCISSSLTITQNTGCYIV